MIVPISVTAHGAIVDHYNFIFLLVILFSLLTTGQSSLSDVMNKNFIPAAS